MPEKQRRSRAELKQMMLDAGAEVLLDLKPSLGFAHLTYGTVFDHLLETTGQKVTIGSVHERIWNGQREFQLEVLAHVIKDIPQDTFDIFFDGVTLAEVGADLISIEGRRYVLQNAVRLSQNAVWEMTENMSPGHRLATTLRLRMWSLPPDDPEAAGFDETIRTIRHANINPVVAMVTSWNEQLNLRVRPDLGQSDEVITSVIQAISAMSTGYLVDVFDTPYQTLQIPTGPNGELEEWCPWARASFALIRGVLEFADEGLSPSERLV